MKNKKELFEKKKLEALIALNAPMEQKLDVYSKVFKEQFEDFSKYSPRARIAAKYNIGSFGDRDLLNLGEALSNYKLYELTEGNNIANMGTIPTIALGVITAIFGNSVLPYIASEQILSEQQGLIYFENVKATVSRGNVTANQSLAKGAGAKDVYPRGFAGETTYGEVLTEADGSTTLYSGLSLSNTPIRKYYVKITAGTTEITDDGKGNLIGAGVTGTVNYVNGAVSLTFLTAPTDGTVITADYATDFETSFTPKINTELDSKLVKAEHFALFTDTSIINAFILKKRFDMDANLRAMNILQQQILREVTNALIYKIESAATANNVGLTNFSLDVPDGVSQQAHFNTYSYVLEIISNKMATASGRGTLKACIAGKNFCNFLAAQDKYKKIGINTDDPTLHGIYDNQIAVIRAPQLASADTAYFLYKGDTQYEASAVYAPFMPLMATQDVPVSDNLLQRRSAVSTMCAVDVVVPQFIQKAGIVDSVEYIS